MIFNIVVRCVIMTGSPSYASSQNTSSNVTMLAVPPVLPTEKSRTC